MNLSFGAGRGFAIQASDGQRMPRGFRKCSRFFCTLHA
jgi:hypothetical protein